MWQEEFDVLLATGKDLVVNGLLKEQGIKILLVTGSLRKMANMSVISVRENMKGLDMNVINVNTKQHASVIFLNINRQSIKELNMNDTSVNKNLHDRVI